MNEDLKIITINVNGYDRSRAIVSSMTLLEFLREELALTGTKRGCDLGECGCCSVLINGKPILSCLTLAFEVVGKFVTTIEGIAEGNRLHPVQEALVQEGAIQCGFCTPGMVINGVDLVENNPEPTDDDIKRCVSATICRCTGYTKIEKAIKVASKNYQVNKEQGVKYFNRTVEFKKIGETTNAADNTNSDENKIEGVLSHE